jgi:hypothetical protein
VKTQIETLLEEGEESDDSLGSPRFGKRGMSQLAQIQAPRKVISDSVGDIMEELDGIGAAKADSKKP